MELILHRRPLPEDTDTSVCLSLTVADGTRFSDVFHQLVRQRFFPRKAGGVWVLRWNGQDQVTWQVNRGAFYTRFGGQEPPIAAVTGPSDLQLVEFTWYPTLTERGVALLRQFSGDLARLEQEGYGREYRTCGVPAELEAALKNGR